MTTLEARKAIHKHRKRWNCEMTLDHIGVKQWSLKLSCRRPGKSGTAVCEQPGDCYMELAKRFKLL